MKRSKLSIIILSYNTKKLLKNCLNSIIKNCPSFTEIIVVDNGSNDGSPELIKEFKKKFQNKNLEFKIILNKRNLGFAKGNNQGLKKAKGRVILLLNSDTIIQSRSIEILLKFLEENPNVAISPLLVLPNKQPQVDYYMRFPNFWQIFLYHNPVLRPLVIKIPFLSSFIAQKLDERKPFFVDQLPGAALMAFKEVWQKVGFLDEDYYFLFEDVDWCWRARKLGIKLMVVPQAKIIHIGGASWKKNLKKNSNKLYYQFFSSMLLFVRKNYTQLKSKIFKWAIILNFLLTLKLNLAWQFFKNDGQQLRFLK